MFRKLVQALLIPLGLINALFMVAIDASRDLLNKIRFNQVEIDQGVCIDTKTEFGYHVHVLKNCTINNSHISSYTYIGENSIIQNTHIGKFCSIASNVKIGLGQHPIHNFSTSTLFYKRKNTLKLELVDSDLDFREYVPIEIGNDVWIGSNAVILDGVKIGNGAVIAAGALISKNVPSYAVVGGVPAKIIKYRFSQEKIVSLEKSKWWTWPLAEIKSKMKELNQL